MDCQHSCFGDIMGALHNFKPTQEGEIEKAYEEILYIETEMLPRLLKNAEKLVKESDKINNYTMNPIPTIAHYVGLYKVLLERQYERENKQSIQSVFNGILPQPLQIKEVKTEKNSKIQNESLDAQSSFRTIFARVTALFGVLGFIWFLHYFKNQFSYS